MLNVLQPVSDAFLFLGVVGWDVALTVLNTFSPSRKPGQVVPAGKPGAGGHWPEYVAPQEGDSRCACPALNALSNHGILPHDGKNIFLVELNRTVRATYNFAPSFCFFVPNHCAKMLNRNYNTDKFDLADLSLHSDKSIEHDASLTREDVAIQEDQGQPHLPFVQTLLGMASGEDAHGKLLTAEDVSKYSTIRREKSKASNESFSLTLSQKLFGSSNSATLLTIYGGRVGDLEPILIEERIPENWEPRITKPWGLTMMTFNRTVFKVARGIKADTSKDKTT